MNIAFIGAGVMGRGMISNLLASGYSVRVYTRTKASAQPCVKQGALWCDTVKDAVRGAEAVITIVGYPKDVEQVYFGEGGILENAAPGTYVIDMTTSSPRLAVKIWEKAKEKGMFALDAPVSGGDTGAKNGTLTVMAGGDRQAFESCVPIFEAVGKSIRYCGQAGSGQHTKMANQIAIAGAVAGVAEAISYAEEAGLDPVETLTTISSGAAGSWQMSNNGMKMAREDYAPGFYIKHFIKDMALAVEEADARALNLPVLRDVLNMYRDMEKDGLGDEGTQAIIKAYRRQGKC